MDTPPVAPDVQQVLKHNRGLLYRQLGMRLALAAALVALTYLLDVSGVPASFLTGLPVIVAALMMFFTLIRVGAGRRLKVCERVLSAYPLEYRTRVVRKESQWLLLGDVHTVKLSVRGQHGAPHMRALNASTRRRWPQAAEDGGAWFAGDPAFGGVMIVPSTKDMLFLQPAGWDKFAAERESADPARLARAQQAGITKKLEREPRVLPTG
ncbi:hypothetical protein RCO28_17345 [Streptomyces sp. LHD-70]|uniref:hypothetical protein n=1 Tax=Streptomyces sp. LHD-70 TaxID=3072140 RepID=UPI00280CCB77|nr:hypothetical protein [Streptomyces sp. LHD-70]MDQ8704240.1 hypothetical protein [Streptomyces sp. LHD-70]